MLKCRKILSMSLLLTVFASYFSSCAVSKKISDSPKPESVKMDNYLQDSKSLTFNSQAWQYDKENNVYWQINIAYCSKPEAEKYETMAVYVPGDYMNAKKNKNGTYTCTINTEKKVNGYTADTAPIVFPVNTAGYSAQSSPDSYSYQGLASYLDAGFVYVYAGMRGRNNGYDENGELTYSGGAPWGVTDLKAAVRYYRYNTDVLPGNTDAVFTFGHSGGGAQSAVMGASGDSELYYDYLMSIGAAMYDSEGNYISDSICGAMCWCPITNLDYANEAYEWNMGQYFETGSRSNNTWTSALSDDLSKAYADYINKLGLKGENGSILTLEASDTGIYLSGSYYNYLLSVIENSFNNFLKDTKFPYTEVSDHSMGDGGFAGDGDIKDEKERMMEGEIPAFEEKPDGPPMGDNGKPDEKQTGTTYQTVQDYIDELNGTEEWIQYNSDTNTASIVSVEAFIKHCKNANKDVAAFDDLECGQAENLLFGNDESDQRHFDSTLIELLVKNESRYSTYEDWNDSIIENCKTDLKATDKLGNDSIVRQNMYNPMYYLCSYYEGYETSKPAAHWRIRTGIKQGDTALVTETNLALALRQYQNVEDVDFETVWGQGHTTAEREGNSTDNFITWVNECLK